MKCGVGFSGCSLGRRREDGIHPYRAGLPVTSTVIRFVSCTVIPPRRRRLPNQDTAQPIFSEKNQIKLERYRYRYSRRYRCAWVCASACDAVGEVLFLSELDAQAGAAFNPVSSVLGDSLSLSTAGVSSSFIVKAIFPHSSRACAARKETVEGRLDARTPREPPREHIGEFVGALHAVEWRCRPRPSPSERSRTLKMHARKAPPSTSCDAG